MMRMLLLAALATTLVASGARATDPPPAHAVDHLQLDASAITGNRELPKVMSIVPWKAAEPPAGPDRPMGSLIEEVLSPLDRDEFQREVTYFGDLASHSADRTTPGVQQP